MSNFQYYSTKYPTEKELVLVIFISKNDSFFDAELTNYLDFRGMMNFSDASRKKKIKSWSNIVPLNKKMVARVESIDIEAKIVNISIAYLCEYVNGKNLDPALIQEKLLEQFYTNKLLESFITTVCTVTNTNFSDIWTKLIHVIDSERRVNAANANDTNDLLGKYFQINFNDKIDNWCAIGKIEPEIKNIIKSVFEKKNYKSINGVKKITSTIKIISQEGILNIKKLFETCFQSINYKFTLKYLSAPNYIFETSTDDSSPDNHHELIKNIKIQIQSLGLSQIFIQTIPEEIAKISQ